MYKCSIQLSQEDNGSIASLYETAYISQGSGSESSALALKAGAQGCSSGPAPLARRELHAGND